MYNQYQNLPVIDKDKEKKINYDTLKKHENKINPDAIKVVAVFISLIGTIVGIVYGFSEKIHSEFNIGLMLFIWIIADIIAVFLYTGASVLEQLVEMNTIIKMWNQTGIITIQSHPQKESSFDSKSEWKCSKCGKINSNYTGTCTCGQLRDSNDT